MAIVVEGEFLDGYHLETIPQFSDNQFDKDALSSIAGMRAVWLLYRMGKWEHLEDLGVIRSEVEPVLNQCCTRYGDRLTTRQAQQLQKNVPQFKEASTELRLAYALQQRERSKPMTDIIYHAEVKSAEEANTAVKEHAEQIKAAGGTIVAGYGRGGSGAIVMVKLPAELDVDPANLLSGSGLRFSRVKAQVIQVPTDMGEDPSTGVEG